ncbi:MAG TPA: hypothetical protein VLS91_06620 [Acidimicrobiales bacterium]|nr:hypothetical protein [Acidimicrobiales bacterium]
MTSAKLGDVEPFKKKVVRALVCTETVAPVLVVMVIVVPETPVTVPVTCESSTSIDPAVALEALEGSIETASPTARKLNGTVVSPARAVVEESIAKVALDPPAVVMVIDEADTAEIVPSAGPTEIAGAPVVVVTDELIEMAAATVASLVDGVIVTSSPTARSLMAPTPPLLVTLVKLFSVNVTVPDEVVSVIELELTALTVPSTAVVAAWSWLMRVADGMLVVAALGVDENPWVDAAATPMPAAATARVTAVEAPRRLMTVFLLERYMMTTFQ